VCNLTFSDFRSPREIETAFVEVFIGSEDDKELRYGGKNISWSAMTAVTTQTTGRLVIAAVVQGQRVEQARSLLLHTQSHEVYSDYLTNSTAAVAIQIYTKNLKQTYVIDTTLAKLQCLTCKVFQILFMPIYSA